MATLKYREYELNTDPNARGGKYAVDNLTYPLDLFGSAENYAQSWVMININVQERALTAAGQDYGNPVELIAGEKQRRIPYGMEEASAATGAATAATVVGLGTALKSFLSNSKAHPLNAAKNGLQAVTNGITAGAAATIPFAAMGALGKRKAKRIKAAIQLPMPNQLTSNYSTNWTSDSTMIVDMAMRAPGASMDALTNLYNGGGSMTQLGDPAANFVLGGAGLAGAGGITAATGLAANPKKEMIFEGVDFRSFNMSYRFYPKSREEAVRLQNVIAELKYHMHPSYLSEAKFTYVYPSEFDITFYAKDGRENQFVNKIATCVLTNMVVNSTPDGIWAAHEEGAPNGIDLQLTFRELSLHTKESIRIGY